MPSVEELEDQAAADSTAGLRERLEAHLTRSMTAWAGVDAGLFQADTVARTLARELEQIATGDVADGIQRHVNATLGVGEEQARARLQATSPRRRILPPIDVIRAAMEAPDKAAEELRAGAALMREARTADDLVTAMGRARRAVTRTEATARWSVNRALSHAVSHVSENEGAGRVWVPERDACVHCLAYAGLYVGPGQAFPGGRTYGEKPLGTDPVADPPLHPNCRCRVIPHRPEWGMDYPDSLAREAQRSILRGWSRASEPERVRLAAAERLLRSTRLPKSVQDYARKAVQKGAFPRGREFPRPNAGITERKDRAKVTRETKADTPPADPFADLPRKQQPIAPGYANLVRSTRGASTGDDELDGDVTGVNPNFHEGQQWQVNCQRVAVALELRRRGYDVEAQPNPKDGNKQYTLRDLEAVWQPVPERWITPTMREVPEGTPGAVRQPEERRAFSYMRRDTRGIMARIKAAGPGARFWLVSSWKAGGAHIWNAEVLPDGTVAIMDGQPGMPDATGHFTKAKDLWMLRVDDLTPTAEQVGMVKPRGR